MALYIPTYSVAGSATYSSYLIPFAPIALGLGNTEPLMISRVGASSQTTNFPIMGVRSRIIPTNSFIRLLETRYDDKRIAFQLTGKAYENDILITFNELDAYAGNSDDQLTNQFNEIQKLHNEMLRVTKNPHTFMSSRFEGLDLPANETTASSTVTIVSVGLLKTTQTVDFNPLTDLQATWYSIVKNPQLKL